MIETPAVNYYVLNTRSMARRLSHQEIVYLYSQKMKTTIFTIGGDQFTVCKNLGKVYSELNSPETFIKIDRSIVVNLSQIKFYEKDNARTLVMKNDHALSVSKREKAKVIKAYFSFTSRTSA